MTDYAQPFWESAYAFGDETSTFGAPSVAVVALCWHATERVSRSGPWVRGRRHALYWRVVGTT